MEFFRNVSRPQYSNGKAPANMAVYEEQARKAKLEREEAEKAALESATRQAKADRHHEQVGAASRLLLESMKRKAVQELGEYVPLLIMNEFFSRIVVKALPHDKEYVQECMNSIITVNKVWLHHLGGFKYLKEQATKTGSMTLKKLCKVVKENCDEVLKCKMAELRDANSESEVQAVLKNTLNDEQVQKIDRDIDDLGTDEIAELVQNKVLDVVKDETKRQAEDTQFRTELAQRAADYENQNNEKLNQGTPDESADNDGDIDSQDDPEEKEPEAPQSESAKLVKYMVDPTIIREHTLFYSMMNSVYYEKINAVKEDADITPPRMVAPKAQRVVSSPLNLNMFDVYLNDYQDDLKYVDSLKVGNKTPLAGSETRIEADDVLAEALMQYTMLEAAMTIKLITPTASEIKQVIDVNMGYRK